MTVKYCFVNGCSNTSRNFPNKKFVTVPRDDFRKKKWFEAVKRDIPKSKTKFYCCEDHFKFEEDIENYMKYKLMGGNIKMKPGVVPHIFIFKYKQNKKTECLLERSEKAIALRQKRRLVEEAIAEDMCQSRKSSEFGVPSNNSASAIDEPITLLIQTGKRSVTTSTETKYRSIGVQTNSYFRSKYRYYI